MLKKIITLLILCVFTLGAQTSYLWVGQIVQDARPIHNALISVRSGRIESVQQNFTGTLPRGAIDLRQFTVVPFFCGFQDTVWNETAPDSIPMASLPHQEYLHVYHPIIPSSGLTAPLVIPPQKEVPILYIQRSDGDIRSDLTAALEYGRYTADPEHYSYSPRIFRNVRKKEQLLEALSGDRRLILYLQQPLTLQNIPAEAKILSRDTTFVKLSDNSKKRSNYVIFSDLRRYFACMDTLNRLPDGVRPLVENPVHWQEFARLRQSTAFLTILWKNPAEYLGLGDHLGGIYPGRPADMMFLSKNPIENGAEIVLIMNGGKFTEMHDTQ